MKGWSAMAETELYCFCLILFNNILFGILIQCIFPNPWWYHIPLLLRATISSYVVETIKWWPHPIIDQRTHSSGRWYPWKVKKPEQWTMDKVSLFITDHLDLGMFSWYSLALLSAGHLPPPTPTPTPFFSKSPYFLSPIFPYQNIAFLYIFIISRYLKKWKGISNWWSQCFENNTRTFCL